MLAIAIVSGTLIAVLVLLALAFLVVSGPAAVSATQTGQRIPGPPDAQETLLGTGTYTGSQTGTAVDLGSNFNAPTPGMPVTIVVPFGSMTIPTTQSYSFKLQESLDGTTWTDASRTVTIDTNSFTTNNKEVIGATFSGTLVANGSLVLGGWVTQRYIRLNIATVGANNVQLVTSGPAYFVSSPVPGC